MKAGQIRIRVEVDDDFRANLDTMLKDWEPELAEDTRKGLESGAYGVYWLSVDQLHCDAPECPHHENIGALGGTVTSGFWTTGEHRADYTLREVLEGISSDDNEKLTELVLEIFTEVSWSPPAFAEAELLPEDRAAIDELI